MSVIYMYFEGETAAHFAVVLHQDLNKLYIEFGLVVPHQVQNQFNKAYLRCLLRPSQVLVEFLALDDILYLWSDEETA